MAVAYEITGAYTSPLSPCVPFDDGSTIWVVAFSAVSEIAGDPNTLQVFKSSNGGSTWAAADGGTKAVYTSRIQVRADPLWPAQPYLYALYCTTAGALHVSRYDTSTETWDSESSGDPAVTFRYPDGRDNNEPLWAFDLQQGADGAALANLDGDEVGGTTYYRVSRLAIAKDTLAWSSAVRLAGQSGQVDYSVGDVIRGDGAIGIHGWWGSNDVDRESFQAVVADEDGSFVNVATSATVADYIYTADWRIDGQLVAVNARSETEETCILFGGSAAAVTWSAVFSGAGSGFGYPIAFSRRDALLDVFFAWPYPSTDIYVREFDGSSLGASTAIYSGDAAIGPIGAGTVGPGSGCVFSLVAELVALQLWFVSIGTTAQIVGGAGIPSVEMFGRSHGVGGGGPPSQCGPGTPVLPAECGGSGPGLPTPPGQQNACGSSIGFAY